MFTDFSENINLDGVVLTLLPQALDASPAQLISHFKYIIAIIHVTVVLKSQQRRGFFIPGVMHRIADLHLKSL